MDVSKAYDMLKQIIDEQYIKLDEPMRKHTSFRIGGPADILVMPSTTGQLTSIIQMCRQQSIPYYIVGNGTNLLVRDKGIRGLVIKIGERMKKVSIQGNVIYAQAGVFLSSLSNMAVKNSLKGLEFASGIPGSLGGAIAMNAGAYGGEMKDVVTKVELLDCQGKYIELDNVHMDFGYRSSIVQKNNYIVLGAALSLEYGEYEICRAMVNEFTKRRTGKQPLNMPNAGSIFKRPKGFYAGKLIQDSGLKGFTIGDAMVSDIHCGFIVNKGKATAQDVISLIRHIQKEVKNNFGVELNTEVKILGEE
ncbi:MAG: UDP-N-acetylmuramate dehydrogenase [Clostridia bacterium]|nr:UDP-N-acetylmuramate dehydrogenase [Clostridia bacterium]